jgi:RNA polymerase sigma factor (sigma-70 family)
MPSSGQDPRLELAINELPFVWLICITITNNPDDASDAAQQVVIKVIAALGAGRFPKEPQELRPWLSRIAHNAAIDIIRRRHPERYVAPEREQDGEVVSIIDALPDVKPSAENTQAWKEVLFLVFQELGPVERTAMIMIYEEKLTQKQVGEELGIPDIYEFVRGVKARMAAVLRRLARNGDNNAQSLLASYTGPRRRSENA